MQRMRYNSPTANALYVNAVRIPAPIGANKPVDVEQGGIARARLREPPPFSARAGPCGSIQYNTIRERVRVRAHCRVVASESLLRSCSMFRLVNQVLRLGRSLVGRFVVTPNLLPGT